MLVQLADYNEGLSEDRLRPELTLGYSYVASSVSIGRDWTL